MALKKGDVDQEFESRGFSEQPQEQAKGELTVYSIRLHKKKKEELERIFDAQGLSLSAGIRQVLYRFLDK